MAYRSREYMGNGRLKVERNYKDGESEDITKVYNEKWK